MSELEPKCPSCGSRVPDWLLCTSCTTRLLTDLSNLPIWWAELSTTYLGQAQHGGSEDGRGSGENPLPYSYNATVVRDSVINTLTTWIRELDLGDTANLGQNMRAWCRWLSDRINRIRGHAAAAELVDEIHYAVGIVRAAVDRPGESVYCGKCPVCEKEMRANPEADKATCRSCEMAGIESTLPVPSRQADAWKLAEDKMITRAQVVEAFEYYGLKVPASTFRWWIHTTRLVAKAYAPNEVPLYLLRDALELARNPERAQA